MAGEQPTRSMTSIEITGTTEIPTITTGTANSNQRVTEASGAAWTPNPTTLAEAANGTEETGTPASTAEPVETDMAPTDSPTHGGQTGAIGTEAQTEAVVTPTTTSEVAISEVTGGSSTSVPDLPTSGNVFDMGEATDSHARAHFTPVLGVVFGVLSAFWS